MMFVVSKFMLFFKVCLGLFCVVNLDLLCDCRIYKIKFGGWGGVG